MATTCTACGEAYKGSNYDAHVFSRGHPTSTNPNAVHRREFEQWTEEGIAMATRGQFQAIKGPRLWAIAVVILKKSPADSRINAPALRDELTSHYHQQLIKVPPPQEQHQADIRRMLAEDYGLLPLSFKTDTLRPMPVQQMPVEKAELDQVLAMFDPIRQ